MIPFPVPPLTNVTVLVTRPQPQAQALCEQIAAQGGCPVSFPAIVIEPIAAQSPAESFDWLIFISTNAVEYGLRIAPRAADTRVAAIGQTTAAALEAADVEVDALPEGSNSEDLLRHAAFADVAGKSILIVKGRGGRDLLREQLEARGARLSELEVYVRSRPVVEISQLEALARRWDESGVDVVTLTSVETLSNLSAICGDSVRERLLRTPFVTLSERIAEAARSHGYSGDCILSRGADHASLIGAIAAWHQRAR